MTGTENRTHPPHRPWNDMVLYQVYPRSFQDSDGDGVGDLPGITRRIDYLHDLGVDGVWLNPIMASPGHDHGYDVSDPRAINPLFGSTTDLATLLDALHSRGMVLIMDLVPNHFSAEHPWFAEALAAPPGSPARDRFIFRPGSGDDGAAPPNNWPSVFGGSAWDRVPGDTSAPSQWYLHLFDSSQPDVNWDNPDIRADMDRTLRHWLELGVDGFRIDVAHGMAKPPGLPDISDPDDLPQLVVSDNELRFDQPGVHELHRRIRSVVDEFDDKRTFAEAWIGRPERLARYLAPDELHHAFGFALTEAGFAADEIRAGIEDTLAASRLSGAAPTWALSNHDVIREVTRYGGGELGLARARAMALVVLALPGIPFVYAGAELGLENSGDIPDERLTDPNFLRTGDRTAARDGERVPLPWSGTEPPYGFSTTVNTWLPQPEGLAEITAERQAHEPGSMLTLYREAIALRKSFAGYREPDITWHDAPNGCLSWSYDGGVHLLLNATSTPVDFAHLAPAGAREDEIILVSTSLEGGDVPANTAVWLDRRPRRGN
ncbi:glycoside hydrolase family 13 protein [Dietzia timorensis]|nr:glycoside hydrolase family 13 protein [Dietzia timorensis]